MNLTAAETAGPPAGLARGRFYYGWVNVGVAALAMVGTLPGRTQGLGLITEPLLADLQIGRVEYARINLWATLVGALFGLGVGRLIDRWGSRAVLTVVAVALGVTVLLMSGVRGALWLGVLVTLTRGFGQSALSVVSLTLVGQWFRRRLNMAMAAFTVALSVGFMVAFPLVGSAVQGAGWRAAWAGVGAAVLLGLAPLSWLLARRGPEAVGLRMEGEAEARDAGASPERGHTLREALRTPAFWLFALSSAVYGLIASGIMLFNESIFAERGFGPAVYYRALVVTAMTGLAGNFLGGWLARRWRLGRLTAASMLLLTCALVALPSLRTGAHVAAYAVLMGLVGGAVMVVFFSVWSLAYGRAHLGKIQGAAQTLTVLASAVGPLLLAECVRLTGSYAAMFYALSAVVAALGLWALFVTTPTPKPAHAA